MLSYYLEAVDKFGGCPKEMVTDLGTENGKMAAMQSFFSNNENAHRYVGSPRNQRIESYWSMYRKTQSSWWINFFKDLVDHGRLNTSDDFEKNCLWFCFAHLIQADLTQTCEHWILIRSESPGIIQLMADQMCRIFYQRVMVVNQT